MKKLIFAILALLSLFLLSACNGDVQENDVPAVEQAAEAAHDHAAPAAQPGLVSGTVLETMNSGGYSYVHVDTGNEKVWAAGSLREGLAVGQTVSFGAGMLMTNFTAKSLDRTFEKIYFVSAISLEGETAPPAGDSGMMGMGGAGTAPAASGNTVAAEAGVTGVAKAAGGYTVSDIYAKASELGGQTVKVQAKVVKFTPNIMGTNWVHIQDGTGSGETADLTVTTRESVSPGDLVLVEGPLSVDKDFGAGYKYHVIIESAKVTKQ